MMARHEPSRGRQGTWGDYGGGGGGGGGYGGDRGHQFGFGWKWLWNRGVVSLHDVVISQAIVASEQVFFEGGQPAMIGFVVIPQAIVGVEQDFLEGQPTMFGFVVIERAGSLEEMNFFILEIQTACHARIIMIVHSVIVW
jgi:hypothetical protein